MPRSKSKKNPTPPGAGDDAKEIAGATAKALGILEAVADHRRPISISEVSALLNFPKPTGHRIATALEDMGFLKRDPANRRLIEGDRLIGLAFEVLAAAAGRGPRHGILEKLAETTGETCNIGVVVGNQIAYIDRVESQWPLGLRFGPGSRVPMHCTAIGKLFLSQLPARDQKNFLNTNPLVRYTENTITDPEGLVRELSRIRKAGVATDNQEFMSGVVCVAVPVMLPGKKRMCAGIAMSAPQARLTLEKALRFVPVLRESSAKMARTFSADDS
ncbi:MAG: IclR family transcriptional regulator [Rhodospirillales bacterium]|nr:IclR family transcriptional regulator [Rhodospirillales bacterium]